MESRSEIRVSFGFVYATTNSNSRLKCTFDHPLFAQLERNR